LWGGGGVAVQWTGFFTMCDASMVANNTAGDSGGGVVVYSGGYAELLGGKVFGNTASGNGGGVWITDDNVIADFGRLFVASGVVFEDNRASVAYSRASAHDAAYEAQIKGTNWTSPFTQGYNNYDISYTAGVPLTTYTVSVSGSYAASSGAGSYRADDSVTVNAGSRSGYTFSGWTVTEGGITLSNTATATFTMPARNVAITANWTPVTSGGDGGSGGGGNNNNNGGSSPKPSPSPSTPTPSAPTPSSSPAPSPSPSDDDKIESTFPLTTVLVLVIVVLVAVVLAVVGVVVLLLRKGSKT
jgi:uncharacterized repeat protein (TIGR02543 family)